MKTIACINTQFPNVGDAVSYLSGESLRDYDIAIFDPSLPVFERIYFGGGGSCLTIEDTQRARTALKHWAEEIDGALKAGKTLFFLLNEFEEFLGTAGYETTTKNQRNYNTFKLNNYQVLPFQVSIKNTKGKRFLLPIVLTESFLTRLTK